MIQGVKTCLPSDNSPFVMADDNDAFQKGGIITLITCKVFSFIALRKLMHHMNFTVRDVSRVESQH